MATKYWLGKAPEIAQVSTASIDSVDATPANNTFTVTIGDVAISQVGDTDVATTAAALVASLNASTHPYFANVTWTNPTSGDITGTADTAGCPFTAALTETGAGTGTVTDFSDDTANSSAHDFANALNWSGNALPSSSDTIIFRNSSQNVAWNLDQSALTGMTVHIEHSYTGKIGLGRTVFATSADGDTTDSNATEYRGHRFEIDWSTLTIGRNQDGVTTGGSIRLNLENTRTASSSQTTVYDTTASTVNGPAIHLLINHTAADLEIRGGTALIGVGVDTPGDTATVGTIEVAETATSAKLVVGEGITFNTSLVVHAGTVELDSAANVPTLTQEAGTVVVEGSGWDITTCNANGGTLRLNGQTDITTCNLNGGTVDMCSSFQQQTVGTLNIRSGTYIRGVTGGLASSGATTINFDSDMLSVTATE